MRETMGNIEQFCPLSPKNDLILILPFDSISAPVYPGSIQHTGDSIPAMLFPLTTRTFSSSAQ
jgi:hypothetical protein